MDKLMDNPWFMRVVALVLAVMLFSSVPKNDQDTSQDVNVPSDRSTEIISDVPIKTYYDTENLVVTGVPETVELTVQGPKNLISQARTLKDFEVYVDLTEVDIGEQRVPILITGISDRISVTIDPAFVNVSVQEKVTQEFRVEPEYDRDTIGEGYIAETPEVNPNTVRITGAKDVIESISYVKATVNLNSPISETVTREANVRVLDRDLNKLDVIVEPEIVEVTIPVKTSSKDVPIEIVREGSSPDGVTIESMTLSQEEATIIADPSILEKTDSVRVEVDISQVTEDTELTLPVIISEGVVSVSPETVKVNIKVDNQDEKTISNIPINIEGTAEQYNVDFINPNDGVTNIIVSGRREAISPISSDDFDLFIDISSLQEGAHEVDIQVSGPDEVNWRLGRETASIEISQQDDV